jgi:hypothetical protein
MASIKAKIPSGFSFELKMRRRLKTLVYKNGRVLEDVN